MSPAARPDRTNVPAAVEPLIGRDAEVETVAGLLAFYDFPAAHWMHLRTTNPIESTFATIRLRTVKTRGCVSRASILSMVFKLVTSAETRWRALRGSELIAKVITGVQFKNGVEVRNQSHPNFSLAYSGGLCLLLDVAWTCWACHRVLVRAWT